MSASAKRPNAPFEDWPVHRYDEHYGFVWWARPAAFVSQSHIPCGTREAAEFVQRCIDVCMEAKADEIAEAGGLFVFHDWRVTPTYDSAGRRHYLSRMRARPRDYLRHSVVAVEAKPLFRMAIEAGNLVAALTARAKVEIVRDPLSTLRANQFTPVADHPFAGV